MVAVAVAVPCRCVEVEVEGVGSTTTRDGLELDGGPLGVARCVVGAGTPDEAGSLISQAVAEAITTTNAARARIATRRRPRDGVDSLDASLAAPAKRPRLTVRSGTLASWPKNLAAVGRAAGSSAKAASTTSIKPRLTPGIGVIGCGFDRTRWASRQEGKQRGGQREDIAGLGGRLHPEGFRRRIARRHGRRLRAGLRRLPAGRAVRSRPVGDHRRRRSEYWLV